MIKRILLAAIVTLGLGAGTWVYEAWPAWYGQEVTLQGLLAHKDPRTGRAAIEFPAARVRIEAPGIEADDLLVSSHLVRQIDAVWPTGGDAVHSARLMQRRVVYVQMEKPATAAPEPGAAYVQGAAYVPVSISTAPVEGAINLRARVLKAAPTGRIDLGIAPPFIPVPPGLDESAFVTAVLRVLPSGRHAIVRLYQ